MKNNVYRRMLLALAFILFLFGGLSCFRVSRTKQIIIDIHTDPAKNLEVSQSLAQYLSSEIVLDMLINNFPEISHEELEGISYHPGTLFSPESNSKTIVLTIKVRVFRDSARADRIAQFLQDIGQGKLKEPAAIAY